jgi:hypothetical protein
MKKKYILDSTFELKIKFLLNIAIQRIFKFITKYSLQILVLMFLFLIFVSIYTKYRIAKLSRDINKVKVEIEDQIVKRQKLKIELQKSLSIDFLKKISQNRFPNHSYTNSNRIILDNNKEDEQKESQE